MTRVTSDRLRILMVSHVPLVRELGGGRVQLQLADELRALGHVVETFDLDDAFPGATGWRLRYLPNPFAQAARDCVRRRGARFDVIDAQQGNLPFRKAELGFDGVLVARSVGLFDLYRDFAGYAGLAWPGRVPGSAAAQRLARWRSDRYAAACRRSMECADLVIVPTDEEAEYVRDRFRVGACSSIPFGLDEDTATGLTRAQPAAAAKRAAKTVVFTGAWSLRKGAADWGTIVARTRMLVPDARFRFLGTGVGADAILRDVGSEHAAVVSVVPSYGSADLPGLLAGATVGALPSYVEGWVFGVLEQLAAGIPTVVYDLPSTRAMAGRVDPELLVERGDAEGFAAALARVLTLDQGRYAELARRSTEAMAPFRLDAAARATLDAYVERLTLLGIRHHAA